MRLGAGCTRGLVVSSLCLQNKALLEGSVVSLAGTPLVLQRCSYFVFAHSIIQAFTYEQTLVVACPRFAVV